MSAEAGVTFERRQKLCLNFAKRTVSKSRHQDIFELNSVSYGTRQGPKFKEPVCNTRRHQKSAKPFLVKLLNRELAKNRRN